MLDIESVNHVGIRVGDKARSVSYYVDPGFALLQDAGLDKEHPVIMKHPSGVAVNLLGPANASDGKNILMDVAERHPRFTHIVSDWMGTLDRVWKLGAMSAPSHRSLRSEP